MTRTILILAGVYGALGVAAGAFGGHALRTRLPAERRERFETGLRYLFIGVLGLGLTMFVGLDCQGGLFESIAAWSFGIGIPLFTGSLIALALTDVRGWGALTPIGGSLLVIGYVSIAAAALVSTAPIPDGMYVLTSC